MTDFFDGEMPPKLRDDVVTELVRFGYAPGHYMGTCHTCQCRMINCAKRSRNCSQCALKAAIDEANKLQNIYALQMAYEASTDGPWRYTQDPSRHNGPAVEMARYGPAAASFRKDADAQFVAAMREAVATILEPRRKPHV